MQKPFNNFAKEIPRQPSNYSFQYSRLLFGHWIIVVFQAYEKDLTCGRYWFFFCFLGKGMKDVWRWMGFTKDLAWFPLGYVEKKMNTQPLECCYPRDYNPLCLFKCTNGLMEIIKSTPFLFLTPKWNKSRYTPPPPSSCFKLSPMTRTIFPNPKYEGKWHAVKKNKIKINLDSQD